MIFPSINALFIHIPKCAGMTIINHFIKCRLYPLKLDWHRSYDSYNEEDLKDIFTFSFVRNPWDRIASHYFFQGPGAPDFPIRSIVNSNDNYSAISTKRQYRYPKGFHQKTFKDFVIQDVCNESINCNRENLFICETITNRLKNKSQKIQLDFIGKVEDFDDDFKRLANHLDLQIKIPEKMNYNREGKYNKLYDNYLYDVIKEYFKEEIEEFNFEYKL